MSFLTSFSGTFPSHEPSHKESLRKIFKILKVLNTVSCTAYISKIYICKSTKNAW